MPVISFSDSEFKKILDLNPKNYSNEIISQIVRDYVHLRIEGEIYSYWNEEEGKREKIFLDDSLFGLFRNEPERYSHRGHCPDHKYVFVINVGGLFHFQNLFYLKFLLFRKLFYRLKPGSQDLYRHISQYQSEHLDMEKISRILGYKEKVINKRQRIEEIKKYLEELRAKGFIRRFEIEGRGEKSLFHIWRYFSNLKLDTLSNLKLDTPPYREK